MHILNITEVNSLLP
ncbi:hypothetical protein ECPA39_0359, partial [Escherichia coli PA39]